MMRKVRGNLQAEIIGNLEDLKIRILPQLVVWCEMENHSADVQDGAQVLIGAT